MFIQKIILSVSIILLLANCKNETVITLSDDMCRSHGRKIPVGEFPTPQDMAKDVYCSNLLIHKMAPHGFVTIFGSTRAHENMRSYKDTQKFAFLWAKTKWGRKYPILTGGGPGIMEAGNRGAQDAGGRSMYFASYFHHDKTDEKINPYATSGYIFSSFSHREAQMIDRAIAIIISPGGFGTEWELFEVLTKIQTKKKHRCPVILLGEKSLWSTLLQRIAHFKNTKTISPHHAELIQVAEKPSDALLIITKSLKP